MPDLLRPPTHRGPLIAAGAVLLTVGIVLEEFRLNENIDAGWHAAICLVAAALFLVIAFQWPTEAGHPLSSQSVLLVAGIGLLFAGLLNLSDALSDDDLGSRTLTWALLVVGTVALLGATRKESGICALLAAVAYGGALLAAWDWIFEPESVTPFRWLLLLLAIVYAIFSVAVRGSRPRHSTQLVNAAGLAIFGIVAQVTFGGVLFGVIGDGLGSLLPGFWELVVLAGGCGLIAYAAADREPGPAYIGVATLAGFVLVTGIAQDGTLEWWPFTLLVLGFVVFAAGMRPRRPLPPEPDAYPVGAAPLAARADTETVVNVRHK